MCSTSGSYRVVVLGARACRGAGRACRGARRVHLPDHDARIRARHDQEDVHLHERLRVVAVEDIFLRCGRSHRHLWSLVPAPVLAAHEKPYYLSKGQGHRVIQVMRHGSSWNVIAELVPLDSCARRDLRIIPCRGAGRARVSWCWARARVVGCRVHVALIMTLGYASVMITKMHTSTNGCEWQLCGERLFRLFDCSILVVGDLGGCEHLELFVWGGAPCLLRGLLFFPATFYSERRSYSMTNQNQLLDDELRSYSKFAVYCDIQTTSKS